MFIVIRRTALIWTAAEEYFSVPLQVARRKLSGMKDSLVTSSVWKPQFKRPLERYPKFELVRMKFSAPQCDACNLGGRISTLIGRVSGKPYDKYDFEVCFSSSNCILHN